MDKQLLKAYVRTLVEDEIRRVLPEILGEAISELKQLKENTTVAHAPAQPQKPKVDRAKLAQMMGLDYDGTTLMATSTDAIKTRLPENAPIDVDKKVLDAITKNYSQEMKKWGII
jgi:hypothetical protein